MLRCIILALATISVLGPSGVAGQSARTTLAIAAPVLLPLPGYQEPDTPGTRPTLPQQVERNRARGALWGAGIGLVAGGLLGGLSVGSDDEGDFGGSLVESAATGEAVLLGAFVGAGIGALLGATVFAPARRATSAEGGGLTLLLDPAESVLTMSGRVRVGRLGGR